MRVRIRLRRGPHIREGRDISHPVALAIAVLLAPASLMAAALACWAFAGARGWLGEFAVSSGLFSHWLTWLGLVAALQLASAALNRHARGGEYVPRRPSIWDPDGLLQDVTDLAKHVVEGRSRRSSSFTADGREPPERRSSHSRGPFRA
jgi:hypothetical protein